MQQTKSLSNYAPTNPSSNFQDWLNGEKEAARLHRSRILKTTAFFAVIVLAVLVKGNGAAILELLNHAVMIAQP
ncbi:MAG TPA: hypothetical protein ENJ95_19340 [Bacteroidetes bacterium]|nr:hypothetical protein [Bacteroidota bacterium]